MSTPNMWLWRMSGSTESRNIWAGKLDLSNLVSGLTEPGTCQAPVQPTAPDRKLDKEWQIGAKEIRVGDFAPASAQRPMELVYWVTLVAAREFGESSSTWLRSSCSAPETVTMKVEPHRSVYRRRGEPNYSTHCMLSILEKIPLMRK